MVLLEFPPTGLVPLINQVGFPIFAFILMYKMARDTINENTQAIRQMNDQMTTLIERME